MTHEVIVTPGEVIIEVPPDNTQVVVEPSSPIVVEAPAAQGPMGPPGPSPANPYQTYTAGEDIVGRRFVRVENGVALYATHTDTLLYGRVVGISVTSAVNGTDVTVLLSGFMDEPTWTWTPGLIWVGANGALVQTPPTSGIVWPVARATSATRIYIQPFQPIEV